VSYSFRRQKLQIKNYSLFEELIGTVGLIINTEDFFYQTVFTDDTEDSTIPSEVCGDIIYKLDNLIGQACFESKAIPGFTGIHHVMVSSIPPNVNEILFNKK
jgi:hypothetical protein